MSDANHIPPHDDQQRGKQPLSDSRLTAYLEGRLSPSEQHEVEQWLADEGMESDAIEGLGAITPSEMSGTVNRLNGRLSKTLATHKKKRRPLASNQYTLLAIGIILMLAIVAYALIRMTAK